MGERVMAAIESKCALGVGRVFPLRDDAAFLENSNANREHIFNEVSNTSQDVVAMQGRPHGLIAANAMMEAKLGLSVVLRHFVEAARGLVGARYVALRVIDLRVEFKRLINLGMSAIRRVWSSVVKLQVGMAASPGDWWRA